MARDALKLNPPPKPSSIKKGEWRWYLPVPMLVLADLTMDFLAEGPATFDLAHGVVLGVSVLWISGLIYRHRTSQLQIHSIVEQLEKAQKDYQTLSENSVEAIVILVDMAPVYVNKTLAEIFGYSSPEEVIGLGSIQPLIAQYEWPRVMKYQQARLSGGEAPDRYDLECRRKDGGLIWVDMRILPVEWQGKKAFLVTALDITKRKLAIAELRKTEERYRTLVEENVAGILIQRHFKPLYVNQGLSTLTGYTVEEMMAMPSLAVMIAPQDRERVAGYTKNRLLNKEAPTRYQFQAVCKDGSYIWMDTVAALVDWEGEIAIQGTFYDISQQKHADEELRKSLEKYNRMASNMPGWVIQFQRDMAGQYKLLEISGPHLDRVDMDRERFEKDATPMLSLLVPEDGPKFRRALEESAANLKPVYWVGRYHTRDGKLCWTQITARPVREDGRVVWDGLMIDVTHTKRMEEDLQKIQKLESLGVLAGGIAHDFNNILTSINGNISLAKLELSEDQIKEAQAILSDAEKACLTAKNLTQQLLSFAKGGAPLREVSSIPGLIRETVGFTLRGSNIVPHIHIAEDLSPVNIDKGQINQVINNLVLNAMQAMPDGGSIWVRAENIQVESIGQIFNLAPGSYVSIVVKDNGPGIPKAALSKVFDPYFSTKDNGTGLGLTITFTIIKRHDGWIHVESEEGRGTTVSLYLPASDQPVAGQGVEGVAKADGRGHRVLVMDDEEMIRSILGKLLERLGYQVGFAQEGQEALEKYKLACEQGQPYHAVIMDLTIKGGMAGKEAIIRLLEYDAKARAIVYSGYANDPVLANFQDYGFKGMITKPFRLNDLEKTLVSVIHSQKKHSPQPQNGLRVN